MWAQMTSPLMSLWSLWTTASTTWFALHAAVATPPSKWTTSPSSSASHQVGPRRGWGKQFLEGWGIPLHVCLVEILGAASLVNGHMGSERDNVYFHSHIRGTLFEALGLDLDAFWRHALLKGTNWFIISNVNHLGLKCAVFTLKLFPESLWVTTCSAQITTACTI